MEFYNNQLFHIYNQGNNKKDIFYSHENYEYFLWKMRAYLLPFGEFVSYSLMPNHFHWQFFVNQIEIEKVSLWKYVDEVENFRRKKKFGDKAVFVKDRPRTSDNIKNTISLNDSIGYLQRSYSRAINKEKGWSGSLFRSQCKAKDGWISEFITLKDRNGKLDYRFLPGTNYAYRLMCYIHDNAREAGLVKKAEEYLYSSSRDYAGLRNGTLCNLEIGRNIMKFI